MKHSYAPHQTYFRTFTEAPVIPVVSDRLTPREKSILRELVKTGDGNKQIGATLGITEGTMKVYFSNMRRKLPPSREGGWMTRVQIAQWADRSGLFGAPPTQTLSEG